MLGRTPCRPAPLVFAPQRRRISCSAPRMQNRTSPARSQQGLTRQPCTPSRQVRRESGTQSRSVTIAGRGRRAHRRRSVRPPDAAVESVQVADLDNPRALWSETRNASDRRSANPSPPGAPRRARCSDKGGTGNCLVHDRLCASPATCQPRVAPSPSRPRRSGAADALSHQNWTGPLGGEGLAGRGRGRARQCQLGGACRAWRTCGACAF
jgi:hypothetical protein